MWEYSTAAVDVPNPKLYQQSNQPTQNLNASIKNNIKIDQNDQIYSQWNSNYIFSDNAKEVKRNNIDNEYKTVFSNDIQSEQYKAIYNQRKDTQDRNQPISLNITTTQDQTQTIDEYQKDYVTAFKKDHQRNNLSYDSGIYIYDDETDTKKPIMNQSQDQSYISHNTETLMNNQFSGPPSTQDSLNQMKICNIKYQSEGVQDFDVKFKFSRFLRLFLYHVLFYYIGPLSPIFITLFDTFKLSQNMGFMISMKMIRISFTQYFQFFCNAFLVLLFCNKYWKFIHFIDIQLSDIFAEQFFFYNVQILIRSLIISIRYGFMSDSAFDHFRYSKSTTNEVASQLLVASWIATKISAIKLEVEATIYRNKIDEESFILNYLEDISQTLPEFDRRLSICNFYQQDQNIFDIHSQIKKDYHFYVETMFPSKFNVKKQVKLNSEVVEQQEIQMVQIQHDEVQQVNLKTSRSQEYTYAKEMKAYSGKLLLQELVVFTQAYTHNYKQVFMFAVIISLLRLFIPFIMRYIDKGTLLSNTWDDVCYSSIEIISGLLYLMLNYAFVIVGLVDFSRRRIMIKAIGAMADPVKSNLSQKYKILPTINLLCSYSLNSWINIRICCLDIGKRYITRIFMYSSIFLGCYLFFSAILILQFFELINYKFSYLVVCVVVYDIFIVLGIILVMLHIGAQINSEFQNHINLMINVKSKLVFIKINKENLFRQQHFTDPYLKLYVQIIKNQIQQRIITYERLDSHIDNILDQINVINEKLRAMEDQQPLKLLGLKASYTLMNTIYTSMLTLGFAVIQRLYNTGFK
eukprot:403346826